MQHKAYTPTDAELAEIVKVPEVRFRHFIRESRDEVVFGVMAYVAKFECVLDVGPEGCICDLFVVTAGPDCPVTMIRRNEDGALEVVNPRWG